MIPLLPHHVRCDAQAALMIDMCDRERRYHTVLFHLCQPGNVLLDEVKSMEFLQRTPPTPSGSGLLIVPRKKQQPNNNEIIVWLNQITARSPQYSTPSETQKHLFRWKLMAEFGRRNACEMSPKPPWPPVSDVSYVSFVNTRSGALSPSVTQVPPKTHYTNSSDIRTNCKVEVSKH